MLRLTTIPDETDPEGCKILVPISSIHFIRAADDKVDHTLVYMMQNGEPFHVQESAEAIAMVCPHYGLPGPSF